MMRWQSTRHQANTVSTSEALQVGLASDGGLFMPVAIPQIKLNDFSVELDYVRFAEKCLAPYFANDVLAKSLKTICQQAFNFPVPIKQLNDNTYLLELFHGPTLAFKDFGARFLAQFLYHDDLQHKKQKPRLIMVATSGDTGSAVASAFHNLENTQVIVLYPKGKITKRQEAQISCWGDNIHALAIEGSFDECQQLVKSAFTNPELTARFDLSTANSINIGRLLPQLVYFAYASVQLRAKGVDKINVMVPSGNLGHITAAHLARAMGFPLGELISVTNANKTLFDYIQTGEYHPRMSIETLANAMDVGKPSNFERLRFLYPDITTFRKNVPTISVNDKEIAEAIRDCYQQSKTVICPHTATAWYARQHDLANVPVMIAATADPCKFETVIEPILGMTLTPPARLQALLDKAKPTMTVKGNLNAVLAAAGLRNTRGQAS